MFFTIFFLPSHAKNIESKVHGSVILCAVCMGVKIDLLLKGKNIKGYLRTGFWGKMLWPKEAQVPERCREKHDEEFCCWFSQWLILEHVFSNCVVRVSVLVCQPLVTGM